MLPRHRFIKTTVAILFIICSVFAAIEFIKSEAKSIQLEKQQQSEIAAKKAAQQKKAKILTQSNTKLAAIVDPLAETYGTKIGAVVIDLSNGAKATTNASKQFVSASIYKLFVAYGIYKEVDSGDISLDDTISSNGTYRTVNECLNLMITISDNDCGYNLGKLYGWANLDKLLASDGYSNTILNNYDSDGNLTVDKYTTANDVAKLLQRLYEEKLLSTNSTSKFLALLKADQINNWLPSGLPDGTVIAHKTGALYGYIHDAGIIYGTDKNTIIVLLTGEWEVPQTDALPVFTSLASGVWDYMED